MELMQSEPCSNYRYRPRSAAAMKQLIRGDCKQCSARINGGSSIRVVPHRVDLGHVGKPVSVFMQHLTLPFWKCVFSVYAILLFYIFVSLTSLFLALAEMCEQRNPQLGNVVVHSSVTLNNVLLSWRVHSCVMSLGLQRESHVDPYVSIHQSIFIHGIKCYRTLFLNQIM